MRESRPLGVSALLRCPRARFRVISGIRENALESSACSRAHRVRKHWCLRQVRSCGQLLALAFEIAISRKWRSASERS
eukprot:5591620-Alexandrium_andersonii.AAC.1